MVFHEFADSEHIKRERHKAQELRKSQWWRQQVGQGICYHCGEKFSRDLLTMDHVVPIARGGKSTKKNCVVSCKACNTEKGHEMSVDKTLRELEQQRESAISRDNGDDEEER
jgi:5-methylcytosine-specific restriction enzyme A